MSNAKMPNEILHAIESLEEGCPGPSAGDGAVVLLMDEGERARAVRRACERLGRACQSLEVESIVSRWCA